MAVAVPVDEVASTTQFGCMPDADQEAMGDAYLQLHALSQSVLVTQFSIAAAMYNDRLKDCIFDSDEGCRVNTAEFFIRWCNMSYHDAQEHVRMAVALQSLPLTLAALTKGDINQQQLKYLTQFLTLDTEEAYLDNLNFKTLACMKRDAAEARLGDKPKDDGSRDRGVRWWKRRFGGGWRIASDLTDAEFAVARAAIERETEKNDRDADTNECLPLPERQADAFMRIMSARIASDVDPDRATVSIHCDLDQFMNRSGVVDVDGLPMMMASVADMLCDSRFQLISERNGIPVGIGRVSRDIPFWLRRLLWRRDKGCRFPNCENTKGIEGHHIKWWRFFGETDIGNLILLCPRHHHLIHDKGWQIIGDPNHQVEFRDPDGKAFSSALPKLKPRTIDFANRLLDQQFGGLRLFDSA